MAKTYKGKKPDPNKAKEPAITDLPKKIKFQLNDQELNKLDDMNRRQVPASKFWQDIAHKLGFQLETTEAVGMITRYPDDSFDIRYVPRKCKNPPKAIYIASGAGEAKHPE